MRVDVRSKNPKTDHDGDEAKDMNEHEDVLHSGQIVSSPDVEGQATDDYWNNQQKTLPSWCSIVWILDDEQTLDQSADEECAGRVAGLPAEEAEPSSAVTETSLHRWWSKFTDPVVLTTCSRSHRSHLGKRSSDESITDESPDVTPEETSATSTNKTLGVGQQDELPSSHTNSSERDERELTKDSLGSSQYKQYTFTTAT